MRNKKVIIIGSALVTLVILVIVFLPKKVSAPSVTTVSPKTGTENVPYNIQIKVVFNRAASTKETSKISMQIQPSIEGEQYWSRPNTLTFTPSVSLTPDTRFTVTVFYDGDATTEFFFTTKSESDLTMREKAIREQTKGDTEFSQLQRKLIEDRPWYLKLPIDTSEYTIVYDFEKESFRIRLKISSNSPQSNVEVLKEKALKDLVKIGVSPQKYSYYLLFKD